MKPAAMLSLPLPLSVPPKKLLKAVILDRDGVINEDSDDYIKSPAEWQAIPHSLNAIAQMNRAGLLVFVATNQSGIARGLYSEATLTRIHSKMNKELAAHGGHLDGIYYCPHRSEDQCLCRKPKPGMVLRILHKAQLAANQVVLVGDSLRDLTAAAEAGVASILVRTGKGANTHAKYAAELPSAFTANNLAESVAWLLEANR